MCCDCEGHAERISDLESQVNRLTAIVDSLLKGSTTDDMFMPPDELTRTIKKRKISFGEAISYYKRDLERRIGIAITEGVAEAIIDHIWENDEISPAVLRQVVADTTLSDPTEPMAAMIQKPQAKGW